jgi:hypothetical protein
MSSPDFTQTWWDLSTERQRVLDRRTELETELTEVRNKIRHLDEVLHHLAPLANLGFYDDEDMTGLGITDAVRYVLKNSDKRLSPQEIREQLIQKGYDLSGLTAPMASIYTILRRLTDEEVEREKEDGRVYYKWKVKPITDNDIPF